MEVTSRPQEACSSSTGYRKKVYSQRIRGLSNQGLGLLGDKLLGVRDDGLCRVCRVSILWKERNEPWMREVA